MSKPEELPDAFWISWTWPAYWGLEWYQRCGWAPREIQ